MGLLLQSAPRLACIRQRSRLLVFPNVRQLSSKAQCSAISRVPLREFYMKFADWSRWMWLFCVIASGASSGQSPGESHEEFICMSGPVKRVVSIFNGKTSNSERQSGGCRVDYTKDGDTKTVWSSKSDKAYCVTKALWLVTKLADGNFTCKPITIGRADEAEAGNQAPAAGEQPER
ncbi:MAG: hypothetical protein JWN43_4997 [Gammaproteobacteria bacterium]|nr:hypothetical protein [Gammaproteobacteria bacterium]